MMKYIFGCLAFLGLFISPALAEVSCSIADSALKKVSEVRGLDPLSKVKCELQTKDQVRAYLNSVLQNKVPPERIEGEEIVYKLLGLIPLNYNYKRGDDDLVTHANGGLCNWCDQ